MKVIVAGGRDFDDYDLMCESLDKILEGKTDITIVSGKAKGADRLGERYAKERGYPVEEYPADWDLYGKGAGPFRNEKMAKVSQVLVAFWDFKSSGTKDMITRAQTHDLELHVVKYDVNLKSTVFLVNKSNIDRIPAGFKKLVIARKPLANMDGLIWLYRLAPSHELFISIKSNEITWSDYVKTYRSEMIFMQPVLDKIEEELKKGKNVAFICHCPSSARCHRGIVGNYYKELGYNVESI